MTRRGRRRYPAPLELQRRIAICTPSISCVDGVNYAPSRGRPCWCPRIRDPMSERTERCAAGLAEIAAEQGLTPRDLAAETGLDEKVIEGFVLEEGDPPSMNDLARFCLAFKLDPLDFLHRCGYFTEVDYAI